MNTTLPCSRRTVNTGPKRRYPSSSSGSGLRENAFVLRIENRVQPGGNGTVARRSRATSWTIRNSGLEETGGGGRSGMDERDAGVMFSAQQARVKERERPLAVECEGPLVCWTGGAVLPLSGR